MQGADIVVAGAGAVGRVTAWRLARAGYRVTVVDPMQANASSVAAGMLAPACEALFDAPTSAHFALLRQARDLWPGLADEIGLPLAREGALALGARIQVDGWIGELDAMGAEARPLAPAELGKIEPRLAHGEWAAFTPEDWRLDPVAALARLRSAAEAAGARFVAGRVLGFAAGSVGLADGARLPAERLVIAAGADKALVAVAPELEALTPIKGHILRAEGEFRPAPVIRAAGVYLCRGEEGAVLGSTMEVGAADPAVDPQTAARLLAAAGRLADLAAPARNPLAPVSWTAAAGVRASAPDGLPLAGPAATPDVILAVGARRNGWLLAPLIAQAVLDAVEDRPPSGAAARFDPARLAGA